MVPGDLVERYRRDGYVVVEGLLSDETIGALRAKIEPDPAAPVFITTVRGVGYRYERSS